MDLGVMDQRRLEKGRYAIEAISGDLSNYVTSPKALPMLEELREMLKKSYEDLNNAVTAKQQDKLETTLATGAVEECLAETVAEYRRVRAMFYARAILSRPAEISDTEYDLLQASYKAMFKSKMPSSIGKQGQLGQVIWLQNLIEQIKQHKKVQDFLNADGLYKLVEQLSEANRLAQKERSDDLQAHRDVEAARDAFNWIYGIYADFLEVTLRLQGEEAKIGQFILNRRPISPRQRQLDDEFDPEPASDMVSDDDLTPQNPDSNVSE